MSLPPRRRRVFLSARGGLFFGGWRAFRITLVSAFVLTVGQSLSAAPPDESPSLLPESLPAPPKVPGPPLTPDEISDPPLQLRDLVLENEVFRQNQEEIQAVLRSLGESLAVANAEAELFRRKYADLQSRIEALGLAGTPDAGREVIEQRLLKAVSDLEHARAETRRLSEQLLALAEASLRYSKGAVSAEPGARLELETQLRSTNETLAALAAPAPVIQPTVAALLGGTVVAIKDDLALLVLNIGRLHGVRPGMPVKIVRDDRILARALVVDVRDRVCGALLRDGGPPPPLRIVVGDLVRLDVRLPGR